MAERRQMWVFHKITRVDHLCEAIGRVSQDPKRIAERYHRCFLLLESDDIVKGSFFDRETDRRGLALPREALERIYYRNAVKIYPAIGETLKTLGYLASSKE